LRGDNGELTPDAADGKDRGRMTHGLRVDGASTAAHPYAPPSLALCFTVAGKKAGTFRETRTSQLVVKSRKIIK